MASVQTPTAWYRLPIVWMIVAIPASAVVMGGVLLYLAVSTYDGLVTDDYYKKGLEINRTMERDEAAVARGLSSVITLDAGGGAVDVRLEGGPGFAAPELVNLRLLHATRPGLDLHLRLRRLADGRYAGSHGGLAPGRWYVQVDADDWRLKGEIGDGASAVRVTLGSAAARTQE